jgi:hypothetical protein
MENYKKFNLEQIKPLFYEIKLAIDITNELISIFDDYLKKVMNLAYGTKFDEYISSVISKIKNILKKKNPVKRLDSCGTTYDKLSQGISYKYKINDVLLAENPEDIVINKFEFTFQNSIILNKIEYFIFDKNININLNIDNTKKIIGELNVIILQLNYYFEIINNDILHFDLLETKNLEI